MLSLPGDAGVWSGLVEVDVCGSCHVLDQEPGEVGPCRPASVGVGFVVVHAAGNLQALAGREKLNAYGALLHGPLAELLWIARVVLL
ncbi:MAG: hypothetical protein ACKOW5_00790, partial [Actinomycetales bacterium]